MSGYFTRTQYDDCYFNTYSTTTSAPLGYSLYAGKFEHDNSKSKTFCDRNYCDKCDDNNSATIPNNWDSVPLRTDIESDLSGRSRILSKCPTQKYLPCGLKKYEDLGAKKPLEFEKQFGTDFCGVGSVTNPWLCERNINPTNLKQYDPSILLEKAKLTNGRVVFTLNKVN